MKIGFFGQFFVGQMETFKLGFAAAVNNDPSSFTIVLGNG